MGLGVGVGAELELELELELEKIECRRERLIDRACPTPQPGRVGGILRQLLSSAGDDRVESDPVAGPESSTDAIAKCGGSAGELQREIQVALCRGDFAHHL